MAGYSGTPLVQKIGIKPQHRLLFRNAPRDFPRTLGKLPEGARLVDGKGTVDAAILFVTSVAELRQEFASLARRLESNGMLWIGWPKKASGVKTDLTENVVRDIGLAAGMVDVKVCAIDDTWSGLKFVYRLKDRK
jgi:hypothetical protein